MGEEQALLIASACKAESEAQAIVLPREHVYIAKGAELLSDATVLTEVDTIADAYIEAKATAVDVTAVLGTVDVISEVGMGVEEVPLEGAPASVTIDKPLPFTFVREGVTFTATLTAQSGSLVEFIVTAIDADGDVVPIDNPQRFVNPPTMWIDGVFADGELNLVQDPLKVAQDMIAEVVLSKAEAVGWSR